MKNENELSIFAANENRALRKLTEVKHQYRTEFQRDRDRILYSKAFRRLSGKTQVFIHGVDDHTRTRLTHTLEVAQIAHTISKELKLNLDLTEAIALGHDLGHAPFGHIGEETLNYFMNGCYNYKGFTEPIDVLKYNKGFKHNWQSVRIVTDLTGESTKDKGLNLTKQTIWGILNHTDRVFKPCKMGTVLHNKTYCSLNHKLVKDKDKNGKLKIVPCKNGKLKIDFYNKYRFQNSKYWTVEAYIVRIADEIAQRHHDIEDGLHSNIIEVNELRILLTQIFGEESKEITQLKKDEKLGNKSKKELYSRFIVDSLVTKLIENVRQNLGIMKEKYSLNDKNSFYKKKEEIYNKNKYEDYFDNIHSLLENKFNYDIGFQEKDNELRKFLKNRILNSHQVQIMDGRASYIIRQLVKAFISNPQQLSNNTIGVFFEHYVNDNDSKIELKSIRKDDIKESREGKKNPPKIYHNLLCSYIRKRKFGELRNVLNHIHYKYGCKIYKRNLVRTICDHIAGMTDNRALQEFHRLYGISHEIKLY